MQYSDLHIQVLCRGNETEHEFPRASLTGLRTVLSILNVKRLNRQIDALFDC